MSRTKSSELGTSINLFDGQALFKVIEELSESHGSESGIKTNYTALLNRCKEVRDQIGFRPAQASIACLSVDTRSEKQARFVDALGKLGIIVDAIDYRWTFVGRSGQAWDEKEKPVSSMAFQLSYLIGLTAGRSEAISRSDPTSTAPEILVVSGSFEMFRSLQDFVQNRRGRAALVFPKSFLDSRWMSEGLFDPGSPIRFIDLDENSEDIFGLKIDTNRRASTKSNGLANF